MNIDDWIGLLPLNDMNNCAFTLTYTRMHNLPWTAEFNGFKWSSNYPMDAVEHLVRSYLNQPRVK